MMAKINSSHLIDLISGLFLFLFIENVATHLDLESDGEIDAAHKIAFGFESSVHQGTRKPAQHSL